MHKIQIAFTDRDTRATERVAAEISTEQAASSCGLPVVVIAGDAYGPADLAAMRPGCVAWLECSSVPTAEWYGLPGLSAALEQAGYAVSHH